MSEQDSLWRGSFGDDYHERNPRQDREEFWGEVFPWPLVNHIHSAIEFGAGKGDNLLALRELGVEKLTGVEVNPLAAQAMRDGGLNVIEGKVQDMAGMALHDLVLTRGFLIHVSPVDLPNVYDLMAATARRFVFMAEYFSTVPREVVYHRQEQALWTRDFAAEFLDRHPEFSLVDYGFVWKRDLFLPQDDITWFLLERI